MGHKRTGHPVRIPLATANVVVLNSNGRAVTSQQILPLSPDTERARHNVDIPSKAAYEVVFQDDYAALGINAYTLHQQCVDEPTCGNEPTFADINDEVVLENELLRVEFDHETGIITSITNKVS